MHYLHLERLFYAHLHQFSDVVRVDFLYLMDGAAI